MQLLPLVERAARHALNASGLESRWIDTSVARQHFYVAKGQGHLPPIVILHGISSAATPFAPVIQRLRPRVRRVLAPDAPAHGFSGAPREPLTPAAFFDGIRELLDRELDEPAILAGNSLGGGMALKYALEHPERVRGVFLMSPAGAAMAPAAFQRFLTTFDLQTRGDALAFMNRLYHKKPWFAPFIASDIQLLFAREHIRSLTAKASVEDLFTADKLRTLTMPVHLIWGRSERLMPAENLAFFRQSLPAHAVIEEPEGFGHCPHLDAPARLADTIAAFAERVASGAAHSPAHGAS